MTQTKHSPVPWECKASSCSDSTYDIYNPDGDFLTLDDSEHEANALLIAAAPALLTALKSARLMLYSRKEERLSLGLAGSFPELDATIAELNTAIAKAEGRA